MQAGGGGRDACSASVSFSFSWAIGVEEAIEDACPTSVIFSFSGVNGSDEVVQTDSSALARLWSIPAGGDDGAGEAFPRALALPVTHTLGPLQSKPRSSAPENAVRCMCPCSALHSPSQRAAFAIAVRCVFLFAVGGGNWAAHSVPVPRLRHHSWVCTAMIWAPDFGGAWHGVKDFQQSYRKIPQKAVLWQKKWAGWLDLSQNLDKFAMIIAKKQKHEGKTFPRCAAQRSVSQATRHIPQTTKASGLEEVQQGREIPYERKVINQ